MIGISFSCSIDDTATFFQPPQYAISEVEKKEEATVQPGVKEQRHFQMEAVAGVEAAFREGHKRIVIVMPTGAGKTYTSRLVFESEYVREMCGVPEGVPIRVLFVAHLDRLLQQAIREYAGDELVTLIPQSAYSKVPDRVVEEGWDIVCIDEAHHEAMHSYQDQLEIISGTPILGLTATPDRDDGKLIKFSAIVEPISRQEAVRQGYLAKSSVRTILDESGHDKTEVLTDIFRKYSHMMGQTLVFVATHREAINVAEVLLALGYKTRVLVDLTHAELNSVLDQFSNGEVQFIVNCSKIDEGVDVKGCTDVVLGRQYGSLRLINQVIGRAARPDCPCQVWELVDPLEAKYTAQSIIKEIEEQSLIYYDHEEKAWCMTYYQ